MGFPCSLYPGMRYPITSSASGTAFLIVARTCSSFGRTTSGCAAMYSSTDFGTAGLLMPVPLRHPASFRRLTLKIDFDHHRRLIAHHPPVVFRRDFEHLRRRKFLGASIRVLDVNLPARQKPHMRV